MPDEQILQTLRSKRDALQVQVDSLNKAISIIELMEGNVILESMKPTMKLAPFTKFDKVATAVRYHMSHHKRPQTIDDVLVGIHKLGINGRMDIRKKKTWSALCHGQKQGEYIRLDRGKYQYNHNK